MPAGELAAPCRRLTIDLAGKGPDLSITPQNTESLCARTLVGWQPHLPEFVCRDVGASGVDPPPRHNEWSDSNAVPTTSHARSE
jgi:hypothetical protein